MDSPSLDSLRQEIDAIDNELHAMVRRRADLVDRISAAKPPGGLALRPGREARVMRQRLATHKGPFPSTAIYRMWREMMCAFTLMQTPDLKIAICRPVDQPGYWDLARDHFGCQIPFVANDTPAQVLAAVRANPSTIGLVPTPIGSDATPWLPLLAGRVGRRRRALARTRDRLGTDERSCCRDWRLCRSGHASDLGAGLDQLLRETAMSALAPRPGIMKIAPYVPGKDSVEGKETIAKLSSNEGALGPSPKAMAAYAKAAAELHRYPDGVAEKLRAAICRHYGLDAQRIVCGAGSDELLNLLVRAYCGPGDELLYDQVGFLMYPINALGVGATPVAAPEKDYHADVDALLTKVTDKTRVVCLANPNNPTGSYVTKDDGRRP